MKPLYILCDPKKARGFVTFELKQPNFRAGVNYIVLEHPQQLHGLHGILVVEGPGWAPYEVVDIIAWFEWLEKLKVIRPDDPRIPQLIQEAT